MNIFEAIKSLVKYGIDNKMLEAEDEIWAINRVCEALKLDSYEESEAKESDLEKILAVILDYAVENGLCEDSVVYRDLFDTKIMGLITPRPSYVINKFNSLYEQSPKAATDFYYKLSQDSDYIRRYRIKNDLKWITETEYGDIDITINLSKPEKDPKAIAAALKMKNTQNAFYVRKTRAMQDVLTNPHVKTTELFLWYSAATISLCSIRLMYTTTSIA